MYCTALYCVVLRCTALHCIALPCGLVLSFVLHYLGCTVLYCIVCFFTDTKYLGILVLGDSVAAHFHIPPEWLTASLINKEVFKNAAFIIENEMDWPQLSLFTAYLNTSRFV